MAAKKLKPCEFELKESYVIHEPAWGSMKMKRPGLGHGHGVDSS